MMSYYKKTQLNPCLILPEMYGNNKIGERYDCNGPWGCGRLHDSQGERDRYVTRGRGNPGSLDYVA